MKNSKKRNFFVIALFVGCALFLFSTVDVSAQNKWDVPAKYKAMKNPKAGKGDVGGVGKALWAQHCKSCHGKEGFGDGKKAAELDTEMRSFADAAFQKQDDQTIYYKAIIGRDEMPNFEKKIPEGDRWLLVNYMRTLKK